MKKIIMIALLCISTASHAALPDGLEILKRVDKNMTSETQIIVSRMIIHGRRGSRTVKSKSWSQRDKRSYTKYLAPARERGTKMLKLENRLWMYSPATDRTIQISGHMLRQSLMGSDLSYEDMMENPRLSEIYHADTTGTEIIANRPCWILRLVAKKRDVAYHSRLIWVDQELLVPLREELYAKSGKILKKTEFKNFKWIDGRWFPMLIRFKDVLKTGEGTEFIMDSIEFNRPIPEHFFNKAILRR